MSNRKPIDITPVIGNDPQLAGNQKVIIGRGPAGQREGLPDISPERTNYGSRSGYTRTASPQDLDYDFPVLSDASQEKLNYERAERQGKGEEFRNFLIQSAATIVGQTIEATGSMLDIPEHVSAWLNEEEASFGNELTKLGKSIYEGAQEEFPVYMKEPGSFSPMDPSYWLANGAQMFSTISMAVPGLAATRGVTLAAKLAGLGKKMSKSSKLATQGIFSATSSRIGEAYMEASGVQQTLLDVYRKQGLTEQEAQIEAAKQASAVYRSNMALLLTDIPQYMALFGMGKNFSGIRRTAQEKLIRNKYASGAINVAGQMLTEGFEEGIQYMFQEEATGAAHGEHGYFMDGFWDRFSEYVKEDEFLTSVTLGAIGGGVFGSLGPAMNDFIQSRGESKIRDTQFSRMQAELKGNKELAGVMDDYEFNKIMVTHAQRGQLSDLQDIFEQAEKMSDQEIRDTGQDPKEFREKLSRRKQDLEYAGELWNRVMDTPDNIYVQTEMFNLSMAKRLTQENLSSFDAAINKIISDEKVEDYNTDHGRATLGLRALGRFKGRNKKEQKMLDDRIAELEKMLDPKAAPLPALPAGLLNKVAAEEVAKLSLKSIEEKLAWINTPEGKKAKTAQVKKKKKQAQKAAKQIAQKTKAQKNRTSNNTPPKNKKPPPPKNKKPPTQQSPGTAQPAKRASRSLFGRKPNASNTSTNTGSPVDESTVDWDNLDSVLNFHNSLDSETKGKRSLNKSANKEQGFLTKALAAGEIEIESTEEIEVNSLGRPLKVKVHTYKKKAKKSQPTAPQPPKSGTGTGTPASSSAQQKANNQKKKNSQKTNNKNQQSNTLKNSTPSTMGPALQDPAIAPLVTEYENALAAYEAGMEKLNKPNSFKTLEAAQKFADRVENSYNEATRALEEALFERFSQTIPVEIVRTADIYDLLEFAEDPDQSAARLEAIVKKNQVPFSRGSQSQDTYLTEAEAISLIRHMEKKYGIQAVLDDFLNPGVAGWYDRVSQKVHLNTGFNERGLSKNTIMHEFLHPFVDIIKQFNPELYQEAVREARKANSEESFFSDTAGYSDEQISEEMLVRYLVKMSNKPQPPKSVWGKIWKFLTDFFYSRRAYTLADIKKLSSKTTVSELYEIFDNYKNLDKDAGLATGVIKTRMGLDKVVAQIADPATPDDLRESLLAEQERLNKQLISYMKAPDRATRKIKKLEAQVRKMTGQMRRLQNKTQALIDQVKKLEAQGIKVEESQAKDQDDFQLNMSVPTASNVVATSVTRTDEQVDNVIKRTYVFQDMFIGARGLELREGKAYDNPLEILNQYELQNEEAFMKFVDKENATVESLKVVSQPANSNKRAYLNVRVGDKTEQFELAKPVIESAAADDAAIQHWAMIWNSLSPQEKYQQMQDRSNLYDILDKAYHDQRLSRFQTPMDGFDGFVEDFQFPQSEEEQQEQADINIPNMGDMFIGDTNSLVYKNVDTDGPNTILQFWDTSQDKNGPSVNMTLEQFQMYRKNNTYRFNGTNIGSIFNSASDPHQFNDADWLATQALSDEITQEMRSEEAGSADTQREFRTVEGSNAFAYLARDYMSVYETENGIRKLKMIPTNPEEYSEAGMETPELMLPDSYLPGTKIVFKVLDNDNINVPFGPDRQLYPWGEIKDKLTPQQVIDHTPIGIYDTEGNLLAYVHDTNWISADTVAKNVEQDRAKLRNIRETIINSPNDIISEISEKGNGVINKSAEGYDTVDKRAPDGTIIVHGKGGDIFNLEEKERLVNNQKKFKPGQTAVVVETAGGGLVALPLLHKKLSPAFVETATRAVRNYVYEELDEFGQTVLDVMGLDLRTEEGVRAYLTHFLFDYNVPAGTRNPNPDKFRSRLGAVAYDMPSTFVGFTIQETGVAWALGQGQGIPRDGYNDRNIDKRSGDIKEELLAELKEHLAKMYFNVSQKELEGDKTRDDFKFIMLDENGNTTAAEAGSYQEMVMQNTMTDAVGIPVNGKNTYTSQPIIRFDTSFALDDEIILEDHQPRQMVRLVDGKPVAYYANATVEGGWQEYSNQKGKQAKKALSAAAARSSKFKTEESTPEPKESVEKTSVEETVEPPIDPIEEDDIDFESFDDDDDVAFFPEMDDTDDKLYQLPSEFHEISTQGIKELDDFLIGFLKNFNVKFKEFDELKSRLGVDALGATDVLNKLIWYVKNRNEETIPEEAAHMLVMLMGKNHPDIVELLANIENWSEFQAIKNQYLPVYKDIQKVKIEAVGKLIAKALVKNYKATGLDQAKIQSLLDRILNYLEKLFDSLSLAAVFQYNERVADHIALNILSGNKNYVYQITNLNPDLDTQYELKNNSFAQGIISKFSSPNIKVTGSLAIAATENIRRPKDQGIHDVDFTVRDFETFEKEVLTQLPSNAVPAHYGWDKKDYTTYAYLIPKEGYSIKVLNRKEGFHNGYLSEYEVYDRNGNKVPSTQDVVMAVDFFVHKEESPAFSVDSYYTPASVVYAGKLSFASKQMPYFFGRDKDQQDYVLRNAASFIPTEEGIFYQLPEEEPVPEPHEKPHDSAKSRSLFSKTRFNKSKKAPTVSKSSTSKGIEELPETSILMNDDNVAKIHAGKKTTTTRSDRQFKEIGIPAGGSAVVDFGGEKYVVTHRGKLSIEEAGGVEAMLASEGVESIADFKYMQTKRWMGWEGNRPTGKLHVYDIVPLDSYVPKSETESEVESAPEPAPEPAGKHSTAYKKKARQIAILLEKAEKETDPRKKYPLIQKARNELKKWNELNPAEPIAEKIPAKLGAGTQKTTRKTTRTKPETRPEALTGKELKTRLKKKNLFNVLPISAPDKKKAPAKASISTQYIGYAEGINGSSTGHYASSIDEEFVNTGEYTEEDVVFVSVPGARGYKRNKENVDKQISRTIKQAVKAIKAGATIITDNKAYTDKSSYNIGEKRLKKYLEKMGVSYTEITVNGETLGVWNSEGTRYVQTSKTEPVKKSKKTSKSKSTVSRKKGTKKKKRKKKNQTQEPIDNWVGPEEIQVGDIVTTKEGQLVAKSIQNDSVTFTNGENITFAELEEMLSVGAAWVNERTNKKSSKKKSKKERDTLGRTAFKTDLRSLEKGDILTIDNVRYVLTEKYQDRGNNPLGWKTVLEGPASLTEDGPVVGPALPWEKLSAGLKDESILVESPSDHSADILARKIELKERYQEKYLNAAVGKILPMSDWLTSDSDVIIQVTEMDEEGNLKIEAIEGDLPEGFQSMKPATFYSYMSQAEREKLLNPIENRFKEQWRAIDELSMPTEEFDLDDLEIIPITLKSPPVPSGTGINIPVNPNKDEDAMFGVDEFAEPGQIEKEKTRTALELAMDEHILIPGFTPAEQQELIKILGEAIYADLDNLDFSPADIESLYEYRAIDQEVSKVSRDREMSNKEKTKELKRLRALRAKLKKRADKVLSRMEDSKGATRIRRDLLEYRNFLRTETIRKNQDYVDVMTSRGPEHPKYNAKNLRMAKKALAQYKKIYDQLGILLEPTGVEAGRETETPVYGNWDLLVSLTATYLSRRGTPIAEKLSRIVEETDESDRAEFSRFQAFAEFLVDPKQTLSKEVKNFMSFIPVKNSKGAPKNSFLGKAATKINSDFVAYHDFDTIYYQLVAILQDSDPSIEGIQRAISDFMDDNVATLNPQVYNWMSSILDKIQEAPVHIQKKLVNGLRKDYLPMKFLRWDVNDGGYQVDLMNEDSNEVAIRTVDDWKNDILRAGNSLVRDIDGQYYVNPKEAKRLSDMFQSWVELSKEATDEELKEKVTKELPSWLSAMGITVEPTTISKLVSGVVTEKGKRTGFEFENRTYALKDLLTSRDSAFVWLNSRLKEVNTLINNDPEDQRVIKEIQDDIQELKSELAIAPEAEKEKINNKIDSYLQDIDLIKHRVTVDQANFFSAPMLLDIARYDAITNDKRAASSFKVGGKTLSAYTPKKFITQRLKELKDAQYADKLTALNFNRHSTWLPYLSSPTVNTDDERRRQDLFKQIFKIDNISLNPMKQVGQVTDASIDDLSKVQLEFTRLNAFTARMRNLPVLGKRVTHYFYSTTSDKSTVRMVQAVAEDIKLDEDGKLSDESLGLVMNSIVRSEIERISKHQNVFKDVESYNKGKRIFHFIPELNNLESLWDEEHFLLDNVLEVFEKGISGEALEPGETELYTQISETVRDHLDTLIEQKVTEWSELGMLKDHAKFTAKVPISNTDYLQTHAKDKKHAMIAPRVAADYVVNNMLTQHNLSSLFWGDPAQYYKQAGINKGFDFGDSIYANEVGNRISEEDYQAMDPDRQALYEKVSYDYSADVQATFINVGKRLAGDIAPGRELSVDSKEERYYTQAILRDRTAKSKSLDFYRSIFEAGVLSQQEDKYSNIDITDAQELTTIDEHMKILYMSGEVEESLYKKFLAHRKKDKNADVPFELLGIRLQNMKPVYVGNSGEKMGVMTRDYIKSSALPLLPQFTRGTELDKLRIAMDEQGIDRVAFSTAVKVGNFENPLDMFMYRNKQTGELVTREKYESYADSTKNNFEQSDVINPDMDLKTSSKELDRHNFRIQLDVPMKGEGGEVNVSTQARQLAFMDLLDADTRPLYRKYVQTYQSVWSEQHEKLMKELDFNPVTGDYNRDKLLEIVKQEAISRDYSYNDILGVELVRNHDSVKLWSLPSYKRIESVLTSVIDSRIRKIKFSGRGFILTSEVGLTPTVNKDGEYENPPGMVFTKSFDPSKGLQHTRYSENGKTVIASQVMIRWPFKNLDINDYLDEDGFLDTSKMPKELLHMFGFRIPNQGLNSMVRLEVVGFLPPEYSDAIVASRDLVTQMGSDFDIDKLYSYFYDVEVNADGKVVKKDTVQNQLLDIHLKVLSNPDPEIQARIAKALDIDELRAASTPVLDSKVQNEDSKLFSPLSDRYQRDKFYSGAKGKRAIGVFAKVNTAHALFQHAVREINGVDNHVAVIGTEAEPFYAHFGSLVTQGTLGLKKTLDGNMYISESISQFLSAAVDNEKEQLLGEINVNDKTYAVITALLLTGMPIETVVTFINQPIIYEYIAEVDRLLDIDKNGVELKHEEAMRNIYAKYYNREGVAAIMGEDKIVPPEYKYASTQTMNQMLTPNDKSLEYNLTQLGMLEQFDLIRQSGKAITSFQGDVGVDSSGIGKNILEGVPKVDALKSILDRPMFYGLDSTVGKFYFRTASGLFEKNPYEDFEGIGSPEDTPPKNAIYLGKVLTDLLTDDPDGEVVDVYLEPDTITGLAATYTLSAFKDMYLENNAMFPYQTPVFEAINDEAEAFLRIPGKTKEDRKLWVFDRMKSWLYTRPETGFVNVDPEGERARLFFDAHGVESLATRYKSIMDSEYVKNNAFLRNLNIRRYRGGISMLTFNASEDQQLDPESLYAGFSQLFTDRGVTLDNGEDVSDFARDLVLATFLSGGMQQAREYTQLVPIEFLHRIGMLHGLGTIDFNNGDLFGIRDPNDSGATTFIEQLIQHNPKLLKFTRKTEQVNKLIAQDSTLDKKSKEYKKIVSNPYKYVSRIHVPKAKWIKKYMLFHLEDKPVLFKYDYDIQAFVRISKLGTFGFMEFNPYVGGTLGPGRGGARSLLYNNNPPQGLPLSNSVPKVALPSNPDAPAMNRAFRSDWTDDKGTWSTYGLVKKEEDPKKLMQAVYHLLDTDAVPESYKEIANMFYSAIDSGVLDIQLIRDDNFKDSKGNTRKGGVAIRNGKPVMWINVKAHAGDMNALHKTILHEMVHAGTKFYTREYKRYKSGQSHHLPKNLIPIMKRLDKTHQIFKQSMISKYGKKEFDQLMRSKMTADQADFEAAAMDLDEFMAIMMTSPRVQQWLNEEIWDEKTKTTWIQRLTNLIYDFLKALGLEVGARLGDIAKNDVQQLIMASGKDLPYSEGMVASHKIRLSADEKRRIGLGFQDLFVRTKKQADAIGIEVGQSGIIKVGDQLFNVYNHGWRSVTGVPGGGKAAEKRMGLRKGDELTGAALEWRKNKKGPHRTMFMYTISPVRSIPDNSSSPIVDYSQPHMAPSDLMLFGTSKSFKNFNEAVKVREAYLRTMPNRVSELRIKDNRYYFEVDPYRIQDEDISYMPTAISADRFQSEIDRYNRRIRRREDALHMLYGLLKDTTDPADRADIRRDIEKSRDTLAVLRTQMKDLKSVSKVEDLAEFINARVVELEEAAKTHVSMPEAENIRKELEYIIKLGTKPVQGSHFFFTEAELNSRLPDYFQEARSKAETLNREITNQINQELLDLVNTKTGLGLDMKQLLSALKDITQADKLYSSIAESDDPLAQTVARVIEEVNLKATKETGRIRKHIDDIVQRIEPKLKRMNSSSPFDVFMQKFEGKNTGDLVHPYSRNYHKELATYSNLYNPIDAAKDDTNRKTASAWSNTHEILVDVRLLMPTKPSDIYHYTGAPKFSAAARDAHIAELKEHLSDFAFNRVMQDMGKKVEEFIHAYDVRKRELELDDSISDSDKKKFLHQWELQNSPYYAALARNMDPVSHSIGGPFGKAFPSRRFTTQVPRKFIDTSAGRKDTDFYDEDFAQVEADPDLLEFYTEITDLIKDLILVIPAHKRVGVNFENSLPFFEKELAEIVSGSWFKVGAYKELAKWAQTRLTQEVRTGDLNDRSLGSIDPDTGKPIREVRASLQSDQEMISNEKFLLVEELKRRVRESSGRAEFESVMEDMGFGDWSTYKSYKKRNIPKLSAMKTLVENDPAGDFQSIAWTHAKVIVAEKKNIDLGTVAKRIAMILNDYKHKSRVEYTLNRAQELFEERDTLLVNALGNPKSGATATPGDSNRKKRMEYTMELMRNQRTNKTEFASKNKILNPEEKKEKARLQAILDDPDASEKSKEKAREKLDTLGGVWTGSKVGRAFMKLLQLLGIGWKPTTGLINYSVGQVSNMVLASDGRFFSYHNFWKAWALTRHSIGKNLSFHTIESPTAKKIRSLMDMYDVAQDASSEEYKSTSKSAVSKRLRVLNAYQITKRVEYVNQSPIMIAVMMDTKISDINPDYKGDATVWEAFDEKGEWKDEYGEFPDEKIDEMFLKIKDAIRVAHGNYDFNLARLGKKELLTSALMQFKTWMEAAIITRFGKAKQIHTRRENLSDETGFIKRGYYRTFVDGLTGKMVNIGDQDSIYNEDYDGPEGTLNFLLLTIKNLGRKMIFQKTTFDNELTAHDAAAMRQLLTELIIIGNLAILGAVLKGAVDDDDEDWSVLTLLLNQVIRTQKDLTMYVMPSQWVSNIQYSMPVLGVVQTYGRDVTSLFEYIQGEEDAGVKFGRNLAKSIPGAAAVVQLGDTGTEVAETILAR